jgi:hemerythrin-like domain-containing protein
MKITEALFAEHLVFHNMFDHIEATVPKLQTLTEAKSLAALMESVLKAHSETEDELFIGPLEHCFEQIGQRDAFLAEHQEIDDSLRKMRQTRQLKQARELLLAAVAYSRRHFDKEERIVFPMAERVLNGKTLESLGQTWMEQRVRVVPAGSSSRAAYAQASKAS